VGDLPASGAGGASNARVVDGASRLRFARHLLLGQSDWPGAGAFLKDQRRRIPRDAVALGGYLRLPARLGKFVTQEEVAEAVGVSRVWYAMLESGKAVKTSPRLLGRIAEALHLAPEHREILFDLALPDLSTSFSAFTRLKILTGSIVPLRTAARRLWSATDESEILLVVAETIAHIFDDSDMVGAQKRIQPGRWDFPLAFGSDQLQSSIAEMVQALMLGMTDAQIDETMLYGLLTKSGDVGTRHELHRHLSQKHRVDRTFAAYGFGETNFIDAHIKSREGKEATVFAVYVDGRKYFSEIDRAVLGTLADVASLALSQ
jgi:transcriptional regulator with XRE-family HTH domain